MRTRLAILLMMLLLPVIAAPPVWAGPAEQYNGPYFGADNWHPDCIRDMSATNPDNICHHMRTGLNSLDSPQVDVLILVPVSPTAERDMRIMRQSIEMWEGGIEYLAGEMGLRWLAEGVDFHITVDHVDPTGPGGEFTTYPIVDPEIVVIATNPVGGIGIGVDPVDLFFDEMQPPCHGVQNPFDFEHWENLPGFDSHHEERSGTYVEDCDGAGGNICFAINGAIDPDPETVDIFGLFDLVSHEVGHCLTLGHVGDGAEGAWGVVPTNDIMAYSADPPGLTKCVSTLDVEAFAARMSRYLDVNGTGGPGQPEEFPAGDRLLVNDQIGQGGNPFQIQHPGDHLYASATGSPMDCPQPDLGLVPSGERTRWMPEPVASTSPVLTVDSPDDGEVSEDGTFTVAGSVEHAPLDAEEQPENSYGTHEDAHDDATAPVTEILRLDATVTDDHVEAVVDLEELWPSEDAASATSYSLVVDGRKFDSFNRYPIDENPRTWDNGAGAYMPAGTSTWHLDAKTVSFRIPRTYLETAGIVAPYFVRAEANYGFLSTALVDDTAPDDGGTVGLADNAGLLATPSSPGAHASTQEPDDLTGTFFPEDSSFGVRHHLLLDSRHTTTLDIEQPSDVTVTLSWDDAPGSDLDLHLAAGERTQSGATLDMPETAILADVVGELEITVDPYFVTAPAGTNYTVSIDVVPTGDGSTGDGGAEADPCADGGCTETTEESVNVYLGDGTPLGSEAVDTGYGADAFAIPVTLDEGLHDLRIVWEDGDGTIAETTRTVSVPGDGGEDGGDDGDTDAPDRDGDGVADGDDNCPQHPNEDQGDLDGDGIGDTCDRDTDGDGHSDAKEDRHGTDPRDPEDQPGKGRPDA